MVPDLESRLRRKPTLIGPLCLLLTSNFVATPVNAREPQGTTEEVVDVDRSVQVGARYSWMDFSRNSDEDVGIRGHRVGAYVDVPLTYIRLGASVGAQKLHIDYKDNKYEGELEDLELELDADPVGYLGVRASGELDFGNVGVGGFLYGEVSSRGDIDVDKLSAKINLPDDFDLDSIASMSYRTAGWEAGLYSRFDSGDFRLNAAVAYTRVYLDFDVDYTETGMALVDRIDSDDIRNGEFNHSIGGFNLILEPSYRIGRFVFGVQGDIVLMDNFSYRVGGSVGYLIDF